MKIGPISFTGEKHWAPSLLKVPDYEIQLTAEQKEEIIKVSSDPSCEIHRWEHLCKELNARLEYGLGFAVIKGIPINDIKEDRLAEVMKRLSLALGALVSQKKDGSQIVLIEDKGKSALDPTVRGHQTSAELPFHCDRCDVVALLCVHNNCNGGESLLASAIEVARLVELEDPDAFNTLIKPFPNDRRSEQQEGEHPWMEMPIFSTVNNRFVSRYIRRFIESTSRFPDSPSLTIEQQHALDKVDDVLTRDDVVFNLTFERGDLQILNNYTVWHSRKSYRCDEYLKQKRLLLRTWISPENSRALPESFKPLYQSTEAGVVRGGVL